MANFTALSHWGLAIGRMEGIYYRGSGSHILPLAFGGLGLDMGGRPCWYFGSNKEPEHQSLAHAVPHSLSAVTAVSPCSIIRKGSFPAEPGVRCPNLALSSSEKGLFNPYCQQLNGKAMQ